MIAVSSFAGAASVQGAPEALHRRLHLFNQRRLSPMAGEDRWQSAIASELRVRLLEGEFVERERAAVAEEAAAAPCDPGRFLAWFEDLRRRGPGQDDPLFPWLAEQAAPDQVRWFLTQEIAGEAGFEDLVALTQLKMPASAKLGLARAYWDAMGQGNAAGMRGPLLGRLAEALSLSSPRSRVVWEALALGNLMIALAANRRYAYHSVGALGAVALTVGARAERINAALERLGMPASLRRYYELYAVASADRSEAHRRDVLGPLLAAEPGAVRALAEGALMRLFAGARCFERYRRELRVSVASPVGASDVA